jgi:hypothetical protein
MNPNENLIELKLNMNPTKNLIEPKLYLNPIKSLLELTVNVKFIRHSLHDNLTLSPFRENYGTFVYGNKKISSRASGVFPLVNKHKLLHTYSKSLAFCVIYVFPLCEKHNSTSDYYV